MVNCVFLVEPNNAPPSLIFFKIRKICSFFMFLMLILCQFILSKGYICPTGARNRNKHLTYFYFKIKRGRGYALAKQNTGKQRLFLYPLLFITLFDITTCNLDIPNDVLIHVYKKGSKTIF